MSYQRIDLKNHMRVLKALEVSIQTGKPYSGFLSAKQKERSFRILRIALDLDREENSLEEAVDLIKRNTRKFARKQITWFRKDNLYEWFSPGETGKMIQWIGDQSVAEDH